MNGEKRSAAGFGAIGIAAAFIFAVTWVVAAAADPSWILGSSSISALGVSDVNLTKDLFKYGCIITGAFVMIYGAGKAYAYKSSECASGILLFFAGIMLILIGLIPSGQTYHKSVAILFFIFLVFAILCAGYSDGMAGRMLNAAAAAFVIAAAGMAFFGISIEMGEAIMVAGALGWLVCDGIKLMVSKTIEASDKKVQKVEA
jgi:hypothetical membrane protein